MNKKREKDEYIERLYYMKEDRDDSIEALKTAVNGNMDTSIIDELSSEDLIELSADGHIPPDRAGGQGLQFYLQYWQRFNRDSVYGRTSGFRVFHFLRHEFLPDRRGHDCSKNKIGGHALNDPVACAF